MRHGKKFNHLKRKAGHRRALLKNMATSLIMYKRITTTIAKAKALRIYLEPLVTKAKNDTTHSRRVVFSYLQSKDAIKELFGAVSAKIGDRPGGYLRIIKTGFRRSDGAEMAMIEFVDFNEVFVKGKGEAKSSKSKTRRTRRGGKKSSAESSAAGAAVATSAAVATAVAEKNEEDTAGEEE